MDIKIINGVGVLEFTIVSSEERRVLIFRSDILIAPFKIGFYILHYNIDVKFSENIISNQINFDFFKQLSAIYKISISGPESCGKTSLAIWLAHEFNVSMVPEVSRGLLDSGIRINNKHDILDLAKKQIEAENELVLTSIGTGLICDTDLLVLYIWCLEKFPPVPAALDALVKYHRYHFTLLCSPDLPWVHDPWRENPFDRERLFVRYKTMLDTLNAPYAIIKGTGIDRYQLAKKILNPILK